MKTTFKNLTRMILPFAAIILVFASCNNDNGNNPPNNVDLGDFTVTTKYDSIRSYPDGGGIFIIHITPNKAFQGTVKLSLEAYSKLNAKLSKTLLDQKDTVVEITLNPDKDIDIKNYSINLSFKHARKIEIKSLQVNLYDWQTGNIDDAKEKLNNFKNWLIYLNPKYTSLFDNIKQIYMTYPQILIVEHWTFLKDDYEIRMCFHVTISPYQWSYIQIRRRGSIEAELSVKQESDGIIHEIPNYDYPKLCGY
jgi:hypothetical protein